MSDQPATDPSQTALNESQASLNNATAALTEQQAAQAAQTAADSRYTALVPDLTKVTPDTIDTTNDKGGMATALSFAAMKDAALHVCRSLHSKIEDMSNLRILLTSEPNLIASSSAGVDVAFELKQLKQRADKLLQPAQQPRQQAEDFVPISAIAAAASALPGVLSLFAKHETLTTSTVPPDDLAAVAAVAGALLSEPKGPALESDTFQLSRRGPLYEQADALASQLAKLQALTGAVDSQAIKDLASLIENTLVAVTSVPKGGTFSPLAAASSWQLAFSGPHPVTHLLLVKSETGGNTELIDQREFRSDHVFLAATASISYILIDTASNLRAAGTESATAQLHGKIDEVIKMSVV